MKLSLIIVVVQTPPQVETIEKKGRDQTQSYDKSPFTNRNVKSTNNDTIVSLK